MKKMYFILFIFFVFVTYIFADSYALDFDGDNDYVNCGNSSAFDLTTNYTIEAWIKVDSLKLLGGIVSKYNNPSTNGYMLRLHPDAPYSGLSFDEMHTDLGIIETGKWYHVAAVNDNGTRHLYLNGEEKTLYGTPLNVQTNSDSLLIGVDFKCDPRYFDGKIDEVRIWNVARSQEEIQENMFNYLNGNESGLVAYWKFDEGSGNTLQDAAGNNNGTLMNMNNSWTNSTTPFGEGYASLKTISNTGEVVFDSTNVTINFSSVSQSIDILVSKIESSPNILPDTTGTALSNQYWIINKYGNGSYSGTIKFEPEEGFSDYDVNHPDNIHLYKRELTSDEDDWTDFAQATQVTQNYAKFNVSSIIGQFLLFKETSIIVDNDSLEFGSVIINDTLSTNVTITNCGSQTINLSFTVSDRAFSTNLSETALAASDSVVLNIRFKPQEYKEYNEFLNITVNNNSEPEKRVKLHGIGKVNSRIIICNRTEFDQITDNFNSIDIGIDSAPLICDLDCDGLYDLLIGKGNGKIAHYEQNSTNSLDFLLVDNNFSNIEVGFQAYLSIGDIDNDACLDLLIGSNNNKIYHYEQDNPTSENFHLVSDNFNNIDYNCHLSPLICNLNNNGLIDLIVGKESYKVLYYEQSSENSYDFNLVDDNFNNMTQSYFPSLTIGDFDDDNLLDLVIGNSSGELRYYRQNSQNSLSFQFITNRLATLSVPDNSSPCLCDIDNDGLSDILVGNNDGKLEYFEQKEVDNLNFSALKVGNSEIKSYYLKAENLQDDLTITSDSDFYISTCHDSLYSQTLTFSPDNLGKISQTIYVKFAPTQEGNYNVNLVHSSSGVTTKTITLTGRGMDIDKVSGKALAFDGQDDYLDCGNDSSVNITSDSISLEAWIKADSWANNVWEGTILGNDEAPNNGYVLRCGDNGKLNFNLGIDGSWQEIASDSLMELNTWYFVSATYDGSKMKLYINGDLVAQKDVTGNIASSGSHLYIGNSGGFSDRYFHGKIDEVELWNIALSEEQIRRNMHLPLTGNENGLVSYWQFNEGENDTAYDVISSNNGTLKNMESNSWIDSTIPFGEGYSSLKTILNTEEVVFDSTKVTMNFSSVSQNVDVLVTKIDTIPNVVPNISGSVYSEQYWVVNKYGDGTYSGTIKFEPEEGFSDYDINHPDNIHLYKRELTSDEDNWTDFAQATQITQSYAKFNVNTLSGQFILIKGGSSIITDKDSLDFDTVIIGDSLSSDITITNCSNETLTISISFTERAFFTNFTETDLAPSDSIVLNVKFKPTEYKNYNDTLKIIINANSTPEKQIPIKGKGRTPSRIITCKKDEFELISNYFNDIDVGDDATPVICDLDCDGLYDLLIGSCDGKIYLYKQNEKNSLNFHLITNNFNNIDVGYYSTLSLYDIDKDRTLDLLIGNKNGKIYHYEQNSPTSQNFHLITDNFNGISGDIYIAPYLCNIDNNGLIDLLLGTDCGRVRYYQQHSQYSCNFDLISNMFNDIYKPYSSRVCIGDFDNDYLLDLILGNSSGNICYYEQNTQNSLNFQLMTNNFNDIDVGSFSFPFIWDINNNGLSDLLIGNGAGKIVYYEQKEVTEIDFPKVLLNHFRIISYYFKAENLQNDLIINSDSDFYISTCHDSLYSQTLTFSPDSLGKISHTIYVKFAPTQERNYNVNLVHSSSGVETKVVTLIGECSETDRIPGKALSFDGQNDYLDCGNDSSVNITSDSISLEAWIKADSWANNVWEGTILGNDEAPNNGYVLRCGDNGKLSFNLGIDGSWQEIASDSLMELNTWYFVSATYDGSKMKLYINGNLVAQKDVTGNIASSGSHLYIGNSGGFSDRYFHGKIDEVELWNVALSEEQIRRNMHLPLTGNENGLVSYWQFNEGEDNRAYDVISENHGELKNMDNNNWVDSTIPFGEGYSSLKTISNTGEVVFDSTSVTMNFSSVSQSVEVLVTKIDTIPNVVPNISGSVYSEQYWVINKYGNGSYSGTIKFEPEEGFSDYDVNHPDNIHLYKRELTSDEDNWTDFAQPTQITQTYAKFNVNTLSGQFILTKNDFISAPTNITIQVDTTQVRISWDAVENATSYKVYASDTPNGTYTDVTSSGSFSRGSSLLLSTKKRNRETIIWTTQTGDLQKKFYRVKAIKENPTLLKNFDFKRRRK